MYQNSEGQKYEVFQDYLGLTSQLHALFPHKQDLLADLDRAMGPITNCGQQFRPGTAGDGLQINVSCDGFTNFDPLELIRIGASEDFLNNGVEAELDELDLYQSQLREHAAMDSTTPESATNPVLREYLAQKEKRKAKKKAKKVCVFCKNNGEPSGVFSSHVLRDDMGNISCPVLRKYTCPLCGCSGDLAHTIKYCPKNNGESPGLALLKTTRLSTGKKRKF